MIDFEVIGSVPEAAKLLQEEDACFGKLFAKSTIACQSCIAPVLFERKVYLMREMCEMAETRGVTPHTLRRLRSREILERLEQGNSLPEIFAEILDGGPRTMASEARVLLVDRLAYLKDQGAHVPKEIPGSRELWEKSRTLT